jgi:energy-coupling factor transport system permease protein
VSLLKAFDFRKRDTIVHRLDPRTKLYLAIILFVLSFMFSQIIVLTLIFISLLLVLAVAKALGQWFKTLRALSFILIFIVIINSLFNYAQYPLAYSLTIVVRLLDIIACFSIFFLTVHPDDFAQALIQLHVPFDFAFTLVIAIRMVPTLAQEAQTIMDAQMSRGLELQKGNIVKQIRNYVPILIPLIVSSIRRAFSVAESLESRAFGSTKKRTYLHVLKMAKKDWIVVLISTLAVVFSIYFNFFVGLPKWATWQIPL